MVHLQANMLLILNFKIKQMNPLGCILYCTRPYLNGNEGHLACSPSITEFALLSPCPQCALVCLLSYSQLFLAVLRNYLVKYRSVFPQPPLPQLKVLIPLGQGLASWLFLSIPCAWWSSSHRVSLSRNVY